MPSRNRWLLLAGFLATLASTASGQGFQAGAAKVDITPPIGFPMWGYGARHDLPSRGVLDMLQARALVLAAGNDKIAIVSLDLGRAPTRRSTAAIRERVKAAGIEHVFLVASHMHHGPVLEIDTWPTPESSYVHQLEKVLADVILDAAKNLKPARIGFASRQVPYNRNRHSKLAEKPVDREILVFRVECADGKPIAYGINFAAHATMTDAQDRRFSADYPGALATAVESETGVPCLFLQGAAGDLSANAISVSGPRAFGQLLAREVLSMAGTIKCSAPEKPTIQVREDDFHFQSRTNFANPIVKAMFVRAFFPELVDFYLEEYRDGIRPHLTTALLNGSIGVVGVSGEFFCTHALNLKRRARLEHLLFLGYCNDYQQYFPTIEAAAEGSYGADPQVSPVELGAGERMMNRALINLYQMRGKLPDLGYGRR